MFFQKSAGVEWLVVFLGNPGDQYEGTRHNVAWAVADALAEELRVPIQRLKFKALTHVCDVGGVKTMLMKPVTYMNLSGEAAGEAARFYKLPPQRVLVVCDDVALPPGRLRLRANGSAGGHNGLKSVAQHLGGEDYPRLRVGVGGKPHPDYDLADWVLARPAGEDAKAIDQAVLRAAKAIPAILRDGVEKAQSQVNRTESGPEF